MRHYYVPYYLHKETAKTKAHIRAYGSKTGGGGCQVCFHGCDGAINIYAESHAEAARQLQTQVLPGDNRLIMGRSNIQLFEVTKEVNR